MPNNNFRKITLTGMMGSGKTIIGKLLAKKFPYLFMTLMKELSQN